MAGVVELAYTGGLKPSEKISYGFESHRQHWSFVEVATPKPQMGEAMNLNSAALSPLAALTGISSVGRADVSLVRTQYSRLAKVKRLCTGR